MTQSHNKVGRINTKQKANGFAYKKDFHKFYMLCLFVKFMDQAQDFLRAYHSTTGMNPWSVSR